MENLNECDFEPINRKMWPLLEESFINTYVSECHKSEPIRTATTRVRTILNSNYEKVDFNNNINESCQHLIVTEQEQLLTLLAKYESFFDRSLGNWDTNQVGVELKEGANSLCSHA